MIRIIAAVAANGSIGLDGDLAWRNTTDLQRFKKLTSGSTVVMGRKTFDSIGSPLPNRRNVVMSRSSDIIHDNVEVVSDVRDIDFSDDVWVIGGAEIYQLAMPLADRLYITEVHANIEGDAMLPSIHWPDWQEVRRERHAASAGNPFDYSFVVYERVAK